MLNRIEYASITTWSAAKATVKPRSDSIVATMQCGHRVGASLVSHPLVAILLILGVLSVTNHMRMGLQIVIEDYVHDHALKTAALLASTLFTWAFLLAGVFGVAKLAFS